LGTLRLAGVLQAGTLQHGLHIHIGCEFDYASDAPVPLVMLVRARRHGLLAETLRVEPDIPTHDYLDGFGNRQVRLTLPGGGVRVRYEATVEVRNAPDPVRSEAPLASVEALPDSALVYTLPSRYVQSDLLIERAWRLFGETPPTWARVQSVCDWVHSNIEYRLGSSSTATTALDILEQRAGVCRDFALTAVALCRALNIPARYTFGYLPDIGVEPPDTPMDFHAWFEAYVGGRWYAFDARHNQPRIGRVVVGRGRDAVDTALSTAYGAVRLDRMVVWADEAHP
jgi:transglutaminase-like putative cysteine protease